VEVEMKTILEALRQTEKQYKTALTKITKDNGVTIAEWQLLQHLDDEIDTQDKLSVDTGLDNSTLSRQLHSLVKKELVASEAIGKDHRQLIYKLTILGSDTLMAINEKHRFFQENVFKVWSEEETSMLQILLNRLNKSMTKPF
jgi:DNA-binding MarR family transcriptional regulator